MAQTKKRAPAPGGPDLRVVVGVIGAVLVLAIASIAFVAAGDDEPVPVASTAVTEFGVVQVSGAALPPLPDGGADPAVGAVAPTMRSERPNGAITVEPGEDGEPTMLVFLAHWCPHCQRELPRIVELADDGALDGIRTVAVLIATDESRPNFPPSAWLDRERWTGEEFYDDADGLAASAYGVSSFPFLVFLDADGKVVQRMSGEQEPEAIISAVEAAV